MMKRKKQEILYFQVNIMFKHEKGVLYKQAWFKDCIILYRSQTINVCVKVLYAGNSSYQTSVCNISVSAGSRVVEASFCIRYLDLSLNYVIHCFTSFIRWQFVMKERQMSINDLIAAESISISRCNKKSDHRSLDGWRSIWKTIKMVWNHENQ